MANVIIHLGAQRYFQNVVMHVASHACSGSQLQLLYRLDITMDRTVDVRMRHAHLTHHGALFAQHEGGRFVDRMCVAFDSKLGRGNPAVLDGRSGLIQRLSAPGRAMLFKRPGALT